VWCFLQLRVILFSLSHQKKKKKSRRGGGGGVLRAFVVVVVVVVVVARESFLRGERERGVLRECKCKINKIKNAHCQM